MSLINFDSWKSIQEMNNTPANPAAVAPATTPPAATTVPAGTLMPQQPSPPTTDASNIKQAIAKGLSGLKGDVIMKATPLLISLQSQPVNMRAKAIARMAAVIGVDATALQRAKSEIAKTSNILQ
jgi:hypothetical protein